MQASLPRQLRCPLCSAPVSVAQIVVQDRGEIREGALRCAKCGTEFEIRGGVIHFVRDENDLDERKRREVEGWKSLTRQKDFPAHWDELLLAMPNVPAKDDATGYWRLAAMSFPAAMALMEPIRGKCILEVGAASTWASRRFAEAGASVVASDINDDNWAGLGKADHYFDHGTPHYERVRCDAERMPFEDSSFDHVFCSSVLHHFERPGKVLKEIARVLRSGGSFIAINEAFHGAWPLRHKEWDDLSGVVKQSIELGINEQTFAHGQYRGFFRDAGLGFETCLIRWDLIMENGATRLGANIALRRPDFKISRLEGSSLGWALEKLGIRRLLYIPPVAALARWIAFNYTGAYRVLVGKKPKA